MTQGRPLVAADAAAVVDFSTSRDLVSKSVPTVLEQRFSRGLMLDDAVAAVNHIFTPPFRAILAKTLLATLALLCLALVGIERFVVEPLVSPYPWLATAASIVTGVGLAIGLSFLVAPVSFIVAGFFFDELAEVVERDLAPSERPGRALPASRALWISLRFSAVSLVVNLIAFALWFVPGASGLAFFGANAYLLGRGYFELAALRFLPFGEVRRLHRLNGVRLFVAGLVMAGFVAVPILNLLSPLFCTAFAVRVARAIMRHPPPPLPRRTLRKT